MNTVQLNCFLTVAQTLNFAKAAKLLNVTQPAVTQQIHSLEEELNVKLFNRTTRTVELTREGMIFMSDAKSILDISERAKRRVTHSFADLRKAFVIGCHARNEIHQFADVLGKMREQFQTIYPMFQVIPFAHLYQQLAEDRLEVVAAFEENDLKKGILYREITKAQAIAVTTRDHPFAQKAQVTVEDFNEEPVVIIEPRNCPRALGKIQYQMIENKSAMQIYVCDSVESSITLARGKYGVAVIPDIFPVKDPTLAYTPIVNVPSMSYGVYYKTLAGHPELKAFIHLAKEQFSQSSAG